MLTLYSSITSLSTLTYVGFAIEPQISNLTNLIPERFKVRVVQRHLPDVQFAMGKVNRCSQTSERLLEFPKLAAVARQVILDQVVVREFV